MSVSVAFIVFGGHCYLSLRINVFFAALKEVAFADVICDPGYNPNKGEK